jgi:hypothetical protein
MATHPVPRGILKRTCFRLADWHRLKRTPGVDIDEMYNVMSAASPLLVDECVHELFRLMGEDASRRNKRVQDIERELEEAAVAQGWPSATGVLPWESSRRVG